MLSDQSLLGGRKRGRRSFNFELLYCSKLPHFQLRIVITGVEGLEPMKHRVQELITRGYMAIEEGPYIAS